MRTVNMYSVIILSVIVLSVVMLDVTMPSVVAPAEDVASCLFEVTLPVLHLIHSTTLRVDQILFELFFCQYWILFWRFCLKINKNNRKKSITIKRISADNFKTPS